MKYPVALHKDKESDYGVTVPDLPGCFSAGSTIEEALKNAQEAIACHIEGLMLDGEAVPMPGSIEAHKNNPDYADAIWAVVEVDLDKLLPDKKRVNVVLPERVLSLIDSYVEEYNFTSRSAFLSMAALRFIGQVEYGKIKMEVDDETKKVDTAIF